MNRDSTHLSRAGSLAYWLTGAALVCYVALCTVHRDNLPEADAWEHHRAVLALTRNISAPGNPTHACDEPSIRYSPYTVALAFICRSTGADPYDALSGAAVFNTVLLVVAVRMLLGALGRPGAGAAALIVMVSLWGEAPGYANSYALSDLPWHQVNPSALSFGLALVMWALFLEFVAGRRPVLCVAGVAVLLPIAMLDHPMTGIFAAAGMGVIAVAATESWPERKRALAALAVVGVIAAGACFAWPWYSFISAVRQKPDVDYWLNPGIQRLMLTRWCPPALFLALASLTLPGRRSLRLLLVASAVFVTLGIAAYALRSPALARLPLPGLVMSHLLVAIYAADTGLFIPSTWPSRMRALITSSPPDRARPLLEAAAAVTILWCLIPQLRSILREPHLARSIVAPLTGHEEREPRYREQLGDVLRGVGERDVVLSDITTSWMVPSVRGRAVAALHYEFFVKNESERMWDVVRFFEPTTARSERLSVLDRHQVRWILLDLEREGRGRTSDLISEPAVVARTGRYVLMSADMWARQL